MKLLLRILRYLAPSKGKIVLVVFVSMITSLFSVVSIYSILPLLNEVFSSGSLAQSSTPSTSSANPGTQTLAQTTQSIKASTEPQKVLSPANLKKTDRLKAWALDKFKELFSAPTRELALLKICLFLIASFAIKNLFIYINGQIIFRIQTKTAKKLRDDVFRSIIEMHLDYFNKNRVGNLMNYVYNDVENVNNSISSTFVNFLQNPFSEIGRAHV